MKRANIYKGKLDWQSEFDHHYACWAANHITAVSGGRNPRWHAEAGPGVKENRG